MQIKKETPPNLPLSGEERREAPYPGLRPYHEDEQGKFFGRDVDAGILLDKVLTNRLTLLFAASGVGKSSLLQAAVIPRLKSPTGENLEVVYHIDWVSEPVSSVRAAVLQALHASGKLPEGAADEVGETLAELLEFCGLFVRHPLVLILDQFEEFFRYQRATASFQPFIEQLTAVITNPQLPVSLVLSMREDFALELNAFKPRLPTILFENFYRLEKLGRESTRKAIEIPVEQVGYHYEPALLDVLLDDLLSRDLDRNPNSPVAELTASVEPPYLQIVCAQLWELNAADPEKTLRLATYDKAGKAKGILKSYLEDVLQQFSLVEKQLTSKAFDHLVSHRGVKMAYTAQALAETLRVGKIELGKVLDKLETVRILRKQHRDDATWYELYHDMFSGSIEDWNNAWKDRMRIRRTIKYAGLGIALIAIIFAGYDYNINANSYYFRISSKLGFSNQVELWLGKNGSIDLFHQQRYIEETEFNHSQLESDKQFSTQSITDYKLLQSEIIGSLPVDQRIIAHSNMGNYNKALKLGNKLISPVNINLSKKILAGLVDINTPQAARLIYEIIGKSQSKIIKSELTGSEELDAYTDGGISTLTSGILLASDKTTSMSNLTKDQQIFWQKHLSMQVARSYARDQLMTLGSATTINAFSNTPEESKVIIPFLNSLSEDKNEYIRLSVIRLLSILKEKEVISKLKNALLDEDAYVRQAAIQGLINLKSSDTFPDLIKLLKDKDDDVRNTTADALIELKATETIPELRKLIKDGDMRIRQLVMNILIQLDAKEASPDIKELLKDGYIEIRQMAVEGLVKLKAKEFTSDITKLLKDADENVRTSAEDALRKFKDATAIDDLNKLLALNKNEHIDSLAKKAILNLNEDMIASDLRQFIKDENSDVRQLVASTLGSIESVEAVYYLNELLKDTNKHVRMAAIYSLARLEDRNSIVGLHELLKDSDENVRETAAKALVSLESNGLIHNLRTLTKNADKYIRKAAINYLVQQGTKESTQELIKLINDDENNVRIVALDGLAEMGSEELIPKAIELINKDNNAEIRQSAANALIKLKAKDSNLVLQEFFKHKNIEIRRAAIEKLDELLISCSYSYTDIQKCATIYSIQLNPKDFIQELYSSLKDEDAKIREMAANVLISLEGKNAIFNTLNLLRDKEIDVRWSLATKIIQFGDISIIPALHELINDKDDSISLFAIYIFEGLSKKNIYMNLQELSKSKNAAGQFAKKAVIKLESNSFTKNLHLLINDNNSNKYIRGIAINILTQLKGENSATDLYTLIDNKDPYIQNIATTALSQLNEKKSIPDFLILLKAKSQYIRKMIIEHLSELDAKETIPKLREMLKDKDIDVRQATIDALSNLDAKEAISELREMLKDEDARVRQSTINALSNLDAKEAISELREMLKDEDARVRQSTINALSNLDAKEAISELREMLNDTSASVRESLPEALIGLESTNAITDLNRLLEDKEVIVRQSVAGALAKLKTQETISSLRDLLNDEDEIVRNTSIKALILFGHKDLTSDLRDVLNNRNIDIRESAATALVQLESWNSIKNLRQLIKDDNIDIRKAAARELARISSKDVIDDLYKMLQVEEGDIRTEAVKALVDTGKRNAIPDLLKLLKDENTDVIQSVIDALTQLESKEATPEVLKLLKDNNATISPSIIEYLSKIRAREAIPNLRKLLKNNDIPTSQSAGSSLAKLNIKEDIPLLLSILHYKNGYPERLILNPKPLGEMGANELLSPLLHKLHIADEYMQIDLLRSIILIQKDKRTNELQKKLITKVLTHVDQKTLFSVTKELQKDESHEYQRLVNQPGLEEKPLTLEELKAKLDEFDQAYADWRERRDTESVTNTETDAPTTDNAADKLADPAPFIYEYAYAIANMDEAEGIKLLGHNLAKVREAAARGLANSDFLGVPLLQKLEQEWLATDNPITRQGLFHAIDIALLAIEGIGADKELEALKTYELTLTNEYSVASIKPRVEWTRIQLQWRVDALKELKELADRQLPGLLKEYCLNPDGTDMKPEECTIER